jgi:hypothetical protein
MKYLIFFSISCIFFSCIKQNDIKYPHFSFDKTAKEWFTEIRLNDSVVFLGSNQTQRVYKVVDIKNTVIDISSFGNWIFNLPGRTYFTTENLSIVFQRMDSIPIIDRAISFSVGIVMWVPDGVDYTQQPLNVIPVAKVSGSFEGYNRIPISQTSSYIQFPNLYDPHQLYSFNNSIRSYNQVLKLFSDNNSTYINPITQEVNTINEVWFDKKFGFVYFKDIYGNSWSKLN